MSELVNDLDEARRMISTLRGDVARLVFALRVCIGVFAVSVAAFAAVLFE